MAGFLGIVSGAAKNTIEDTELRNHRKRHHLIPVIQPEESKQCKEDPAPSLIILGARPEPAEVQHRPEEQPNQAIFACQLQVSGRWHIYYRVLPDVAREDISEGVEMIL